MPDDMEPKLEDVFKLNGVPTITFVPPAKYDKLVVSLRTPGRGLVVEGPSGIGKTTAVERALAQLGVKAARLSARKREDRELIALLPQEKKAGFVLIDDFHRLDEETRGAIADFMKTLADEESTSTKIVIVGINRAGDALVRLGTDVVDRIEVLRFESEPEASLIRLVELGEDALNTALNTKAEIAVAAQGSFYLTQMLCHETCLLGKVTERQEKPQTVEVSYPTVLESVMEGRARRFFALARKFAAGPALRPEGRAPYLHILKWLADSESWSVDLAEAMNEHREHKQSVGQIVTKGFLQTHIQSDSDFSSVLHYERTTTVLSAEDPQFVFFLRNLAWQRFAHQVGYVRTHFKATYDVALSFAGEDRAAAEKLFTLLTEDYELAVFYDKNEESRILAENVEEYLGPIYRSEASFVVVLLGPDYPKKIWTKFESEQFKDRFGEGAVIPIFFKTAPLGMFDTTRKVGGLTFDPAGDVDGQLKAFAKTIAEKVARPDDAVTTLTEGGRSVFAQVGVTNVEQPELSEVSVKELDVTEATEDPDENA